MALGLFGALTKLKSAANDLPYTTQVALGLFGQCNAQASKVAHSINYPFRAELVISYAKQGNQNLSIKNKYKKSQVERTKLLTPIPKVGGVSPMSRRDQRGGVNSRAEGVVWWS